MAMNGFRQSVVFVVGLVLSLSANCSLAGGRIVYVDNRGGDDKTNGTMPVRELNTNGPTESIQTAFRRVMSGGTVVLLPSGFSYREEVVIDGRVRRGYSWQPLVLEGNGLEWTAIPPNPLPDSLKPPVGIEWLQAPISLAERLEQGVAYGSLVTALLPFPAGRGGMNAGACGSELSAAAGGMTYYPAFGWNYLAAQRSPFAFDRSLREYVQFSRRLRYALVIHRASYVVVRNVCFKGFSLDAVQVHGPVDGIVFENCSFSGCGRAGLAAMTNAHVGLRNCSFEDNAKAGVLVGNFSRVQLAGSKVQAKPKDFERDESSRHENSGGEFKPLESGPFNVPEEFRRRHPTLAATQIPGSSTGAAGAPVPKPPAPKAFAPAPAKKIEGKPPENAKPKKSFFDE